MSYSNLLVDSWGLSRLFCVLGTRLGAFAKFFSKSAVTYKITIGRSVVTMAQFDPDNLRIARPSEVLGNIKVLFCKMCFSSPFVEVFNGKT